MDRYDDLDLDLECEEGNVSQKAAIFGGMFKRSMKSTEPSLQFQDDLSSSKELSKSNDSLTDGNTKDKGVFKGMFKKTSKAAKEDQPQATLSIQNPELSASSDSLDVKSSKDKSAVKLKRSPRLGHNRRASQDLLDFNGSNDNLSENTKESGGMFSGMFKKSPKPSAAKAQSEEDLSASSELSGSTDNLSANTKESGGVFSGLFKKPPKRLGARTQSQDDLSADGELSGSSDNVSVNSNTKESGGMFSGMFKKGLKHRTQSQEDLAADGELSGSSDNLSANGNTKESGGMFSGMFKKPPKHFGARSQSKEDLSAPGELSGSNDNLSENPSKEKGGLFSGVFKKKVARSQSQDDLSMDGEPSADGKGPAEKSSKKSENSEESTGEKPKTKPHGFSAMMKSTFHPDKKEKSSNSDDEDSSDNEDGQTGHKQSKLAGAMNKLNPFRGVKHEKQMSSDDEDPAPSSEKPSAHKQNAMVGAMSKLNPFRSANKKDTEDGDALKESEQQVKEKPKPVKSNMSQPEKTDRSETPSVPPRSAEKGVKWTSADDREKSRRPQYNKENKDVRTENPEETPEIPARPTEQEMSRTRTRELQKQRNKHQNQSEDEGIEGDVSAAAKDGEETNTPENKATRVKRHKQLNPFMPRAADRAASDDEGLKDEDESSSKEEKKEEEGQEKTPKPKVRRPKKHNPFMPRVKAKVVQRNTHDEAENEGANRSLFDQLEEYRVDPGNPDNTQDTPEAEDLMDWWNTVEPWEERPEDEDLTEKEEAKAFAVTAEKVQKGIRVFNKLFSERAESLWQHVIDLNAIADGLDKFNKNTKIAQITGGSTSAIGGVATITGLALAPVTFGTSLIVTAVGLGIATAGGLTSAGAGISNQVNNSMDRKKVEKIVEDYQEKITDLNKCLKFIKQGIENLRRFDLMKMKNHAYNQDFPALTSSFYEDGAMAGKAILINANEIMRVVQIANVAGSTAARAVQIASMATGVLTGLFVGMDIYFVAKDSKILKKGAKSEFAAKIREVATQLHDGLVELNTIREELQSTTPENRSEEAQAVEAEKKEKEEHHDSSSEDEIDRIKKAIKKEYENKEYV
ncbi:unnamed protein product [Ophioblennius macclurei]